WTTSWGWKSKTRKRTPGDLRSLQHDEFDGAIYLHSRLSVNKRTAFRMLHLTRDHAVQRAFFGALGHTLRDARNAKRRREGRRFAQVGALTCACLPRSGSARRSRSAGRDPS